MIGAFTAALLRFVTAAPFASTNRQRNGTIAVARSKFKVGWLATGDANPAKPYTTRYVALAVALLPAASDTVQVTVFVPTELVTSGSQLCESTPDRGSLPPALAVPVPLSTILAGLTDGASVGAVLS